jgi:multisubunit Na+/H+ antiporter MnhB subunit
MKMVFLIGAGLLLSFFVFAAVVPSHAPSAYGLRDYLLQSGQSEIGAVNLVSAIYLGYRLYDTLGEAVVLLLAVSAVLFFLETGT